MAIDRPRNSLLALAFPALLLGAGCGGGQKDPDATRGGAKPIATVGVETDKIDADKGDYLDYKLIQVPDRGLLTINIHWDRPRISGRVQLMDKFGMVLETKERNQNTATDTISRPVRANETYFIEIMAEEGASVYSIATTFSGATGGMDDEVDPVPYCIELMEGGGKSGGRSEEHTSELQSH